MADIVKLSDDDLSLVRRSRLAGRHRGQLAGPRPEAGHRHRRQQGRHRLQPATTRSRSPRSASRWSTRSAPATPSTPACWPRCTSRRCCRRRRSTTLSETAIHEALSARRQGRRGHRVTRRRQPALAAGDRLSRRVRATGGQSLYVSLCVTRRRAITIQWAEILARHCLCGLPRHRSGNIISHGCDICRDQAAQASADRPSLVSACR